MNSIDVNDENKMIKPSSSSTKAKLTKGRRKLPLSNILNIEESVVSTPPAPSTPKKDQSLDELMAGLTISPKIKKADGSDKIGTSKKGKQAKNKGDKTVIIYEKIKAVLGPVGGDACGGPIYGEVTFGSFQRILNVLENECGLNNDSIFVDIGSGLGKPNFHVTSAAKSGVKLSIGIEVVGDRWIQSIHVLDRLLRANSDDISNVASKVFFAHADICHFAKTGMYGVTHMYSFNVGMPIPVKEAIVDSFMATSTATHLICFDKPAFILEYCSELELFKQFCISMHGSAEGHTVFFYRKLEMKSKQQENAPDILDVAKNLLLTSPKAIPTDPDFVMCTPHAPTYSKGLSYFAAGKESYKDWVRLQSSANLNTSRMTRRSKRENNNTIASASTNNDAQTKTRLGKSTAVVTNKINY